MRCFRLLNLVLLSILPLSAKCDDLWHQFHEPDTVCAGVFAPAREYVGAQCPHPMLEVGYKTKISTLDLYPESNPNLHMATDLQKLLSANIYWKWVRLGYSFALGNYNHGFNFDYSFTFGAFNMSANVAHVRNFKLVNRSDFSDFVGDCVDNVRFRDLRSTDWGVNLEYMLDHKRFSGLSVYDYSYHRPQLKSHGSPIFGLSYAYNSVQRRDFPQSLVADEVLDRVGVGYSYAYTANIGAGYGYSFSFADGKYVLGVMCVPYFSVGYSDYMVYDESSETCVDGLSLGVRAKARTNFTYSYQYGAFSISAEYLGAFLPNDDFNYRRDIIVLRINHAFKLGEYGLKSCKMPLRRFMNKTQQAFIK